MIEQVDRGAHEGGAEGDWVRRMAAVPFEGPPLPDGQLLWWKSQALHRLNAGARRRAAADQIQIGIACAAAAALLVYLFADGGSAVMLPVAVPVALSIVLLILGVAMASSSTRRLLR